MTPAASLFVLAAVLFLAGSWCVWAIHRAPEVGTSVCHRCMDGEPE